MPRPREFASHAERQAAYRARQRQEGYEARLRADQQRQALADATARFQTAIHAAALAGDPDAQALDLAEDLAAQLDLLARRYTHLADQLAARQR